MWVISGETLKRLQATGITRVIAMLCLGAVAVVHPKC